MAVSPNMKRAVRHLADLLGEFARSQGWGPDDYRTYFRINESWDHIHILFVARGFEGRDDFEWYKIVNQYLEDKLKGEPELFHSIGLVIQTFKQVEEGGLYAIGPEYVEVKPRGRRNVLKRAVREVAGALTKYAEDHGWSDNDYWIYYSVDPELDQVRFYYIARGLDNEDNKKSYEDISSYLEKSLRKDPEVLNSFQLRVGGKEQLDRKEISGPGPGFKEYWALTRN